MYLFSIFSAGERTEG